MDLLAKCASNYQKLMDYEYHFTLGRKGKLVELVLKFSESDFHHLAGLHKLKGLHIARILKHCWIAIISYFDIIKISIHIPPLKVNFY